MTTASDGSGRDAVRAAIGCPRSASELLPIVYDQLRALAQRQLNGERAGHTLSATALVHEAHLRLASGRRKPWGSEAQFYTAAAEAMRRVLLDHARARGSAKRGGGCSRMPVDVLELAAHADAAQVFALDSILRRLEQHRPDAAAVVRLRFFAGQTIDRTAELLGQSPRQVDRLWAYARAWLYRELQKD